MKITINVTAEHIAAGQAMRQEESRSNSCPITRAIRDAGFPKAQTAGRCYWLHNNHHSDGDLPPEAVDALYRFDARTVPLPEPFSFELNVTKEAARAASND